MQRRALMLAGVPAATATTQARAEAGGLVTVPSRYDVAQTIARFESAVRAEGWVVFGRIDHAEAARKLGMTLDPRTVILFGNPRSGTPAMQAHPTLALDLPMRVLVWQDGAGRVSLTRSSGADLAQRVFARHGVGLPKDVVAGMEAFQAKLARAATQ